MYTPQTLTEFATKSDLAIKNMQGQLDRLNAVIEKAQTDPSRSRDWVVSEVKQARERATPAMGDQLRIIQDLDETSGKVKKFWESKPLLLSIQTFDPLPEKDAAIRMCYASELGRVPLPMLAATFENAKFDKALALIYQCWLAGAGRSGEAGFTDSCDLALGDDIVIPGQATALAAISTCHSNRAHAEMMFSATLALHNDPVRRLSVGRQQNVTHRLVEAAAAEAQSD